MMYDFSRLGSYANRQMTPYRFGPIAQYHENSLYYSAIKPEANPAVDDRLPHITVEMPVYKESLEETM